MVEDEKPSENIHFILKFGFKFQNICGTTNLLDILTKQNYDDLETLILMFF